MGAADGANRKTQFIAAAIAAGVGLLTVVMTAEAPSSAGAPRWIGTAAGLAFLFAGAAMLVQALGRASPATGELAPDAPGWTRWAQALLSLAIWIALAAIGSWVAFGPGERVFGVSIGGLRGGAQALVGRTVFGFGAVLTWLGAVACAWDAWRRLRRRPVRP